MQLTNKIIYCMTVIAAVTLYSSTFIAAEEKHDDASRAAKNERHQQKEEDDNAWRTAEKERRQGKDIAVYDNDKTDKPYVVIGKAYVEGSRPAKVIKKMKDVARDNGANAILNFKMADQGATSQWTSATLQSASGILVRWAKPDEKGVTAITDKMQIPIVQ